MRLAVVSPFVDRQHGTERALAEVLGHLRAEPGWEIFLYAQNVEDLPLAEEGQEAASGCGNICWRRIPRLPGPHLVQFCGWLALNGLWRWWDSRVRGLRFDLTFSPGINCLHPDATIVHVNFHRLAELSRTEGRNESELSPGHLRRMHRRMYYWLLVALEKRIYADRKVALAAVSRRTAAFLETQFGRNDVSVIPDGVDLRQYSLAVRLSRRAASRADWKFSEDDFILLLIGNDWWVKGLPVLLKAAALCRDLPLRILVAGAGDVAPFEQFAARIGVGDQLHLAGPRADVRSLYAAADAYVSPTREDSFALPVLEAMACGLPVVTSAFAGVSELIEDGQDGFVLRDPADSRALAELLRQLHRDGELRRRIGENAARAAQDFTWEKHAEGTRDFLKRLAEKKYGPAAV